MTEVKKSQDKEGKIQEMTARVTLTWQHDLAFLVSFDIPTVPSLKADEPPNEGGSGEGPNASRLLGASVGNCLSASLAFCLKKSKIELKSLTTDVQVRIARNERGFLRVRQIRVDLRPELKSANDASRIDRCRQIFEDYCIVTGAVRQGIPVEVNLKLP